MAETFDIVVIGAGHAGIEAALAAARLGQRTLLLTLNLDSVALMPCNPSIGGTAKGHLVREVDALGGEMGLAIDETFVQSRMLNTGKGPAVHSLRAQADKRRYQLRMRRAVESQPNLWLRQAEVARILTANGAITGVITVTGAQIDCRAVVVASGVYLKSRIIIGEHSWQGGPQGLLGAGPLADSLADLGFALRRFKTGTPARVDGRTLDFSKMQPQGGDEPVVPFSFMTESDLKNQAMCYLTYTTPRTHEIIMENMHRAPMYTGAIHGTGARYCPSIEDKVVRFADKERHPIFLEPEGLDTVEWYAQGLSTSLPEEVQRQIYRSVPGMEHVEILRLAYAIEYDCIDPTTLNAQLGAKEVAGLYFAGQINGTSGYEEAAAQGLLAGVNAAQHIMEKQPLVLSRADGYIGVLVDDLITKGTDEPYRMMTSRAEYRLLLRQDNADLRLTPKGYEVGLVSEQRYQRMVDKQNATKRMLNKLSSARVGAGEELNRVLETRGEPPLVSGSIALMDLLRRPKVIYQDLQAVEPSLEDVDRGVAEQLEITAKYEGYLQRQQQQTEKFHRAEKVALPQDVDYSQVGGLRIEAQQKLNAQKPASLGQAARIPGVSPGDISVLMVWLEKRRREKRND